MNGWIKIHRRLLEWEWHDDKNMLSLWIHLLLKASPTDRKWHNIEIKRGQYLTSLSDLSQETGLTKRNLRTCIDRLKNDKQIDTLTTHTHTIITICNYERYQVVEDDERHTNDTLSDTPPTHRAKEQKETDREKEKERTKEIDKEINQEKIEKAQEGKKPSTIIDGKEKSATEVAPPINLEKRRENFYQSLIPYTAKYTGQLLRDFYDYWTEMNRSQTKMRFELERTWEVGKRLATWAKHDKAYNNGQRTNTPTAEQRLAKLAAILTG